MSTKTILAAALGVAIAAGGGYALYTLGMRHGKTMAASAPGAAHVAHDAPAPSGEALTALSGEDATRRHIAAGLKAGDVDPASGKRILYYHDPMSPQARFDKPGKSPFMDMMLVPVFEGGAPAGGGIAVSPRIRQSLGVRTAAVTEGTLAPEVSAVGAIAFNERDQVVVQARATGFVERLHVRATLDRVAAGQPLAELHVPEWIAAQEEFLAVRRMAGANAANAPLVDAARQRMHQMGIGEAQIAAVESSGRTATRVTITAPIGGVLAELNTREGMTVMAGATLFRINGLATVWADAEVPETQIALVRPGLRAKATSPSVPDATFEGRVQAILPDVNPATRTVKARVELANRGGRLAPGMFVQMQFADPQVARRVLVPSEAVIQTGRRTVVMLAEEGRFRSVDVAIGLESNGQTEVKRGLVPGQQVVVSGQFLIDSEASLKSFEARINAEPDAAAPGAPRHTGIGTLDRIEPDALTLTHEPIASLKWGRMTMEFDPPAGGLPKELKPGDRVRFEFFMTPEGVGRITSIGRAP